MSDIEIKTVRERRGFAEGLSTHFGFLSGYPPDESN
jgi:hypothetical protein